MMDRRGGSATGERLDILTYAEASRRIRAMTDEEYRQLERNASLYAVGTELTPRDLLHHAIQAILEDRRGWRQDLSLVVFVTGLMRSIGCMFRKSLRAAPVGSAFRHEGGFFEGFHASAADEEYGQDPLYWVLADEDADRFLNALTERFADDWEVRTVIEGRLFGESAFFIRSFLGLNESQYETVCRRLTRGCRELRGVLS